MPVLNHILPDTLSPGVKNLINFLVIAHVLVFFIFIILLVRSFMKGPSDHFRDQVTGLEKQAQQQ